MSISNSYIQASYSEDDELDSLPSSDISDDISSNRNSDAQEEWEASIRQLELILTMVIIPYMGKFFGRKLAFWSWAKYMMWKYPAEVTYPNDSPTRTTSVVKAAATL